MATPKQKKAVEVLVESGGTSVSEAMRQAGYSAETAHTPQKLTESKGYKELLAEYLPDDLILSALREDIEAKKGNRKPELELATKIKGWQKDEVEHSGNVRFIVTDGD